MKIAFFSDTYLPYTSGAVMSLLSFSRRLKERGHQVRFVVPSSPGASGRAEGVYVVPSLAVPQYPGLRLAFPLGQAALASWVRDVDIIHAHSPFTLGLSGLRLARHVRERDIPVVFTCHSLYEEYARYVPAVAPVARWLIRAYTVRFCNNVSLVLAPSSFVKKTLEGWGVRTRIAVLPTGVNLDRYRFQATGARRRTLGIASDTKLLLYTGRLAKEKNLAFLIRAFARAARDGGQALHLVLIGGGPEERPLQTLIRERGLQQLVTFTGVLPQEEVMQWYLEADLFVFASLVETQGMVLLESMAAGVPVVALRSPATAELVSDGEDGFLTEEREEIFAGRILSALKEPVHSRMGPAARRKAAGFDEKMLAEKLEQLYLELIRGEVVGWRTEKEEDQER
ncbi:MAG: glycosyltransferase family 4 protein [Firmicutes bacterium]|nr:glycosyltransferase family 4 protein [Bacillota bacterium]